MHKLGNEDASMDLETLISRGVTHILVSAQHLEKYFPDKFQYLELPLDDHPNQDLTAYFKQAINFIKNSKVIFVHCAAGVSRSASIVISFLMVTKNWKYVDAYNFVKGKRSVIYPNSGFVKQLKGLELQIQNGEFNSD